MSLSKQQQTLLSSAQEATIDEMRKSGKSLREIAKATGVPYSTVYRALKRIAKNAGRPEPELSDMETALVAQEYIRDENPRTLEDLIRVCNIDTEAFEIVRFEVNKWEVGAMTEEVVTLTEKSAAVKRGSLTTAPLFQIKVVLKPRQPGRMGVKEFVSLLAQDIKELSVRSSGPLITYQPAGDCLFELDPFDMHFGKFCYAPETVTNFDLNIASDLFENAVQDLITKASGFGIEKSLIVIGNDVTHIDGPKNQTFAGTTMDVDTRFTKIFRRAHKLHSWAIRRLLEIGPVDVLVMPGNHDTTSAWHLGHVIETEFADNPNVKVDNAYRARKYYSYGNTLLGFTHGDKGRENELPLQMAREVPQMWAASEFREWHRGHLHKYSETKWRASESYAGVIVRTLNTLTAHDKWHTDEGYMDRRAMQAFVHHKSAGLSAMMSSNVIYHTGLPAK